MLILVQTQTLTTTNSGQLEFKELSVVKTLLETTRGRVQAYFGSWHRYVPVWGSLFHLTANFCCGHQGLFIIHVLNFDLTKNAFFVLFFFLQKVWNVRLSNRQTDRYGSCSTQLSPNLFILQYRSQRDTLNIVMTYTLPYLTTLHACSLPQRTVYHSVQWSSPFLTEFETLLQWQKMLGQVGLL